MKTSKSTPCPQGIEHTAPRARTPVLADILRHASVLKSILPVAVLASSAILSGNALAGPVGNVGSNHKFGVVITEAGSSWTVDMSGILNYDPSTGSLAMPEYGSTLGAGWEWAPIAIPGTTQTVQGIKWHTPERLDTSGPEDSTNPWKSTFTFTATGNVDPFMTYAFAAKNNTGVAQTYTFTYGEALIPSVSGLYDIYADIAGGVSNGTGSSVKVDPVISDLLGDNDGLDEIQILRLSTDGGAIFVNAGVDVGLAIEAATTSAYGVYDDALSAIAAIPFNYWEITTQFTLSPGKDTAVFTGFVEIKPSEASIPEPSTYALILGAVVLGFTITKRRRLTA